MCLILCLLFDISIAFKAVSGTAPVYPQTLVRPHVPAQALRCTTLAARLVPPLLRANKARSAKSRLLSVLALQWWKELPANVRTMELLAIFHKRHLSSDFTSTPHSTTPSQPQFFFFITLSTVICCSFFPLTKVPIVTRFGQKHLLNAPINRIVIDK